MSIIKQTTRLLLGGSIVGLLITSIVTGILEASALGYLIAAVGAGAFYNVLFSTKK